jgi:hypothetical protein
MNYEKYINLGFKRIEMNDNVEFKQTGYYGFCLTKKVNKKLTIEVCSGELDKPKLYIQKVGFGTSHILNLTPEMVIDLLKKETQECLTA